MLSPEPDETGEGEGLIIVTELEGTTETVAKVPWETVTGAGPFCAPATWNINAAGMIKNLDLIGLVYKILQYTQKLCHADMRFLKGIAAIAL